MCFNRQACLTVLAVLRYRQGVTETFLPAGYEPDAGGQGQGVPPGQSPFSGYSASEGTDSFQQQPFSAGNQRKSGVPGSDFRAY